MFTCAQIPGALLYTLLFCKHLSNISFFFFNRFTIYTPGHLEWDFLSNCQSKLSRWDIRDPHLAWQVLEGRAGTFYIRLCPSQFLPRKGVLMGCVVNPPCSRHLCRSQEMYLKAVKISLFHHNNNRKNTKIYFPDLGGQPLGEKHHTPAAVEEICSRGCFLSFWQIKDETIIVKKFYSAPMKKSHLATKSECFQRAARITIDH